LPFGHQAAFRPTSSVAATLHCVAPTSEMDCAKMSHDREAALSTRSDQAITLRRRRIRNSLVARDDPVELACRRLRNCSRLCQAARTRTRCRHRHRGIAACCARAASGQAMAAPPSSVMKSRRLMSNIGLPPPRHIPPGVVTSAGEGPSSRFTARSACHREAG